MTVRRLAIAALLGVLPYLSGPGAHAGTPPDQALAASGAAAATAAVPGEVERLAGGYGYRRGYARGYRHGLHRGHRYGHRPYRGYRHGYRHGFRKGLRHGHRHRFDRRPRGGVFFFGAPHFGFGLRLR